MTVDEAVAQVRAIEVCVLTGMLAPPFPADVTAFLAACIATFADYAATPERAREVIRRVRGG